MANYFGQETQNENPGCLSANRGSRRWDGKYLTTLTVS